MLRGISGGQKKRVTTGEMVVGPCKTLMMDGESTVTNYVTTDPQPRIDGDWTVVTDPPARHDSKQCLDVRLPPVSRLPTCRNSPEVLREPQNPVVLLRWVAT